MDIFEFIADEGRRKRESSGSGSKAKVEVMGARIKHVRPGIARSKAYSGKRFLSTRSGFVSAVAKSSFLRRSPRSAKKIGDHVRYLEKRSGRDRDERTFFDRSRVDIDRAEVTEHLIRSQGRQVGAHKIILSPGDNSVNLKEYARESMATLEKNLGFEIDWYAVEHRNTDHYHVHVIVAGKIPEQRERERDDLKPEVRDALETWARHKQGHDLRLYRHNLESLRAAGNDYLLRERSIDRLLDQAIEREFGIDNWTYDREVDRQLGLKLWEQDRNYLERELGIMPGPDGKYSEYDRQVMKEFGLNRVYDLGRPYSSSFDGGDVFRLGKDEPDKERDPDRDIEIEKADPVAQDLFETIRRPSIDGDGERSEDELSGFCRELAMNRDDREFDREESGLVSSLYSPQDQGEGMGHGPAQDLGHDRGDSQADSPDNMDTSVSDSSFFDGTEDSGGDKGDDETH